MMRGRESPEYAGIAPWFFEACEIYVEQRTLIDEPFFAAMVCGDVKGLVYGADDNSQRTLFSMLKYLYNHVPSECWGSEAAMARWLGANPPQEGIQ